MRRSPLLAGLALVAGLAAVPASADYPPTDCESYLVLAGAGASDGCDTIGVGPTGNRRVLGLTVLTGAATATLGCGGSDGPVYVTVEVAAPYSGSAYIDRTSYCWMTVTALYDGTTAVATNHSGTRQD
jgi:hypothetical protein